MQSADLEVGPPNVVAVPLDLTVLRAARDAARSDFDRIKGFAYAIADIVGQSRASGPAEKEFGMSLVVMRYLDDLLERAEKLAAAQRPPFHI